MKSSKNTPDFTHKHKLKNSTSRPNCKLESIQLQSTVHNHCNIGVAPNPANPKKQQPLHKGDNTKSKAC